MWTVERSSRRASITRSHSSRSPSVASVTSSHGGYEPESPATKAQNLWQTKPYVPTMDYVPRLTSLNRAPSQSSISSRTSHSTLVNDVEDTTHLKTPTANEPPPPPPKVASIHTKPLPPSLKKLRHRSALPDFDNLPDSAALPDFGELPDSAALPDFDDVPPTAMYPPPSQQTGEGAPAVNASGVPTLPPSFMGPLEQMLMAMIPKIQNIEKTQPSVMAEDYAALKAENEALKKKYDNLFGRYEALFALRDEDLQNLIKVRGLLATERRQHEGLKKLREDDLQNLVTLRDKLAKNTWSNPNPKPSGTSRTKNVRASRAESSTDLWQVAKMAALEQRCIELEKVNKSLKNHSSRSGTSTPIEAPSIASASNNSVSMDRIESLLENTISQREKIAAKVQRLRSEKDNLQKTVEQLEDRNTDLESNVERLERRLASM